jgi:hypothetical protein
MFSIPRNRVPPGNANLIFLARTLIKRYGGNAYRLANSEAELAREGRDLRRMQCWRRIAAYIRRLDERTTAVPDH